MNKAEPILIWGAGAIGGILGSAFAEAGHEVHFVDIDSAHVQAINEHGIKVQGPLRQIQAKAKAFLPDEVSGIYKISFLAVKSQHTAAATRQLLPHLADNGVIVSAQNGLNEKLISTIAGSDRTFGCFVNFSAEYLSPGLLNYGVRAAVVCGELDGSISSRAEKIHALLSLFDDKAILTSNIWGFLWGKMVYGSLLYASAITDAPIWEVLGHPAYAEVLIKLGQEVAALAQAEKIKLEAFDGFDPLAFMPEANVEQAIKCLKGMSEHNFSEPERRSGIWRDIKIRKRKTEVDGQLLPLLELAKSKGLDLPLLTCLVELVHQCEGGLPQSWENLDKLKEEKV